jgi:hypothetical protein
MKARGTREVQLVEPMRDPREALNHIMEALVFTFRHDADRRTFLLITDFPFKSPGSIREFAAFLFEDAHFERLPGDRPAYERYHDSFQAHGPGGIVVQDIQQKTSDSGQDQVELWFGPGFGGLVVTYGEIRGYTRGSTAEKVGPMEWVYRDSKTNKEFDFDYPFPSLAGPTSRR